MLSVVNGLGLVAIEVLEFLTLATIVVDQR